METSSAHLKELTLTAVSQTGRELGAGAYGEVVEVRLSGLKCAGKKLHGVFFKQSPPSEQRAIVSRFVEECVRLSKLRHPNIVQLIGVHFTRDSQLPMMIMELLPMSLTQCLERYQQIPGYTKYSILYDVSLGLLYLHSQTPPLIHRDLTANNVLLTSNMSAKLADLGVARIVNLNPAQLTAHMTQCPGTPAYMPPEALTDRPRYDEKLDMFSFGNLILHICTQQWPLPAPFLAYDPQNPGMPKPLTEIQRRQKYIDLIDKRNPLRALAQQCLQNFPSQRPSTANIAFELEQIHKSDSTSPPEYLELAMESLTLKEKEKECMTQINQLRVEITQLRRENLLLQQKVREKDDIIAQLRKEKPSAALATVKEKQLVDENTQLQQQIIMLKQQVCNKDDIAAQPKKEKPSVPLATENRYSQPIRTISCPGGPGNVVVTANGDVIVTEQRSHSVTVFSREGSKHRSFGSKGRGKGQFYYPMGVAITADSHILVADTENHRVQKFTIMGEYVTSVGSEGSGPLQFSNPSGLAVHPSGKIFVAETVGDCVQVLNPDLSFSHMFGSGGSAPKQFRNPVDVACDSQGMVYVAENGNNRIQKFTPDGEFMMMIGSQESQTGKLSFPLAVAVDQMHRVYVAEEGYHRVSVFSNEGKFIYSFGSRGSGLGNFNLPYGLAFDQNGHLYISDLGNNRIVVY